MADDRDPNGLVRRAVRGWWEASKSAWDAIPKPADDPVALVTGPDTAHIVLLGDGPAMGFGVASHDIALPGHLARHVARLTGRGVRLQLITDPQINAAVAVDRYREHAEPGHRFLVLLLGSIDAVRLTTVADFADGLAALLDQATSDGVGRILIVGIPPFSTMPIVPSLPARLAQQHALKLERALQDAAAARPHAHYLPFTPPAEPSAERYRSAATYREWAALIAPELARLMDELDRDERRGEHKGERDDADGRNDHADPLHGGGRLPQA